MLSLSILIGVLLFGKLFSIVEFFLSPQTSDLGISKSFSWDEKSATNIVFASLNSDEKLSLDLISIHPKDDKVIILNLPMELYLDVPKSFGSWPLGSVYKLGQSEKNMGGQLTALSVAKLVGLPVDGLLIFKPHGQNSSNDLISTLHKNPVNIISFLKNAHGNLSPVQTLKVLWLLSQVRSDKIINLNLADSEITESKLLPDSSRVLGVDSTKMDYFVRTKMADEAILDEGASIAIFNATNYTGLAQEVSRMVTNMGGNVILVTNTEQTLQSTRIIWQGENQIQSKSDSLTYLRLGRIFAPNCLKNLCTSDDIKIKNSRAMINIVLGADYFKNNFQR